jgi:hypothetical protein
MGEWTDKAKQIDTQIRRGYVFQLRKGGMTYRQIADAVIDKFGIDNLPKGWDERYAYTDIKRELDHLHQDIADSAAEIIELETQRLDAMLTVLWPQVAKGNQGAVDRVLRIMDRRAKLLGLDAPTKQDVTSDGKQITLRVVYDE